MLKELSRVRRRQLVATKALLNVPDDRLLRASRTEQLFGYLIVIRNSAAADLGPEVVAAAGGDHGEMLARKLFKAWQLVLRRAKLVEGILKFDRQQLRNDTADRFEREPATGELDLPGRRDDIRLVAGVQDERLAVDAHNRLEH